MVQLVWSGLAHFFNETKASFYSNKNVGETWAFAGDYEQIKDSGSIIQYQISCVYYPIERGPNSKMAKNFTVNGERKKGDKHFLLPEIQVLNLANEKRAMVYLDRIIDPKPNPPTKLMNFTIKISNYK